MELNTPNSFRPSVGLTSCQEAPESGECRGHILGQVSKPQKGYVKNSQNLGTVIYSHFKIKERMSKPACTEGVRPGNKY